MGNYPVKLRQLVHMQRDQKKKTTVFGEKTGKHFTQIREHKYQKLHAKYQKS